MSEPCCTPDEIEYARRALPLQEDQRSANTTNKCPACGAEGKPVPGQTVKALLSVSLRDVQDVSYLFCKTQNCPVVYFLPDGKQTFNVDQIREPLYQKAPHRADVLICYCFQHTVGKVRAAAPEAQTAIIEDIITGIRLGQCACDLRNPQGSCCLGNVRKLIKEMNGSEMNDPA